MLNDIAAPADFHGDYIKTAGLNPGLLQRQIIPRQPSQFDLFFAVHTQLGIRIAFKAAALDFAENEDVTLARDDVQFTASLPPVARDDGVALTFQIVRCEVLAPIACLFP